MKTLRLRRLNSVLDRPLIIVPLDHGVTLGPVRGIENIRETVDELCAADVDALVMHKGCVAACRDVLAAHSRTSVFLHLSASLAISPAPNRKVLVAEVDEAVRLGVDGVSVHVNLGNTDDATMLEDLGHVAKECRAWGMPLLVMAYARGPHVNERGLQENLLAARVSMELGADIVKIAYPECMADLARIVRCVSIPVVVAGGDFREDEEGFHEHVRGILGSGARGIAVGRNIFQRANRRETIARLSGLLPRVISPGAAIGGRS